MHRKLCAVHTVQLHAAGNKPAAMTSVTWEQVSSGTARYAWKASVRLPVTVKLYEVFWNAGLEGKRSATATKTVRRVVGWVKTDD